jgi:hypothetical protein
VARPGRNGRAARAGPRALFGGLRRALGPTDRALCAYLDLSPAAAARDGALSAFRRCRDAARAGVPAAERAAFDAAAARAERYLATRRPPPQPGLVLFALPRPRSRVRLLPLPARPVEAVGWIGAAALPRLGAVLLPDAAGAARRLRTRERAPARPAQQPPAGTAGESQPRMDQG